MFDDELNDLLQWDIDAAECVVYIVPADLRGERRGLELFCNAFYVHALIACRPDQRRGMDKTR